MNKIVIPTDNGGYKSVIYLMTEEQLIEKLNDLTAQKNDAIKSQKYEHAATLRDDIRKYTEMLDNLMNPTIDD